MASRGLCSFGEPDLMTDAARLLFGEEPTEPDVERASAVPSRGSLGSTWCSSAPSEERASTLLFEGPMRRR